MNGKRPGCTIRKCLHMDTTLAHMTHMLNICDTDSIHSLDCAERERERRQQERRPGADTRHHTHCERAILRPHYPALAAAILFLRVYFAQKSSNETDISCCCGVPKIATSIA